MTELLAHIGIGLVICSGIFCLSVLSSPAPHHLRGSGASTIPQKDKEPEQGNP